MNEYRCKGCLVDSTHGKLQKKKEVLLEFIFADNSLCLTVSAQDVNIVAYTISRESIGSFVAMNDLLWITFKTKNQIKISALPIQKIEQLRAIIDALHRGDSDGKVSH